MGRKLDTSRVAAVFSGEDMMEMLGVLSVLFIWEQYSDASLCPQIHKWYPDQGMCKVGWWKLKISRLAKITEQEDWTPSGDDERDSKNLNFDVHAHMCLCARAHTHESHTILLSEGNHQCDKNCGLWESLMVGGSQMPADTHCQTSRLCRKTWLDEPTRGLAGKGPSGGVGHISALNSRDQDFF